MREALAGTLWVSMVALGCSPSGGPDQDADGDSISDADEGYASMVNTDGDAWEDWLDLDTDGDGLPDAVEAGDDSLSTPPVDTDGDGTPDFRDLDSDDDGIPDGMTGPGPGPTTDTDGDGIPDATDDDDDGDGIPDSVEGMVDSDGDGVPNHLDLDADGDGVPDAIEGNVDTDGDLRPDYLDGDSDADGIADGDEDLDGDGMVAPCTAAPCESSRTEADTDGDGVPDLVERVAGSDPTDPASIIDEGDFYFVLPFEGDPADGLFDFQTDLQRADVFFSVDTTGSFGEEIAAIQATIGTGIVPGVRAVIPDAAFGVGRFEDFPVAPYGLPGDRPIELLQAVTTDAALVMAGVDALPPAAGGLDTAEAGVEALFQWATGHGLAEVPIPPFAPGDVGGAGFRSEALPILIHITDARSHDPTDYAAAGITTRSRAQAIEALGAIGARVIGIRSTENEGTADDPRDELEAIALGTRATIPPSGGECATGIDGAARAPVMVGAESVCPLVFDVRPDGSGLGAIIVDAIQRLASLGTLDISARATGGTASASGEPLPVGTTTADFITSITPEPPAPTGATIDGDVFRGVTPGSIVQFRLTAQNDFVRPTRQAQLFTIDVDTIGDGVTVLDSRQVFVIVPAEIEEPIIF